MTTWQQFSGRKSFRGADAFALAALIVAFCAIPQLPCRAAESGPGGRVASAPAISSLEELSVESLRARTYGSRLTVEAPLDLGRTTGGADSAAPRTYITSFRSDGLRQYARLDLPAGPMPEAGYPVVVFLHGWVGLAGAPKLDFRFGKGSIYGAMIDEFTAAGFLVITPGFRGHGTVGGRAAEGIEYLATWDNGTYVSPVFYAIDALNLMEGLGTLAETDGARWGRAAGPLAHIDQHRINVIGHSQGGDVALIVMAVCGRGSPLKNAATAGSIWSGTFPSRLTQLATYHPIETTPQAFLAGDGTWTATATGANGAVNPNFVFGYPPDWIETPQVRNWTWQRKAWSRKTVASALKDQLDEMYGTANRLVGNLHGVSYQLQYEPDGKVIVRHDPRVVAAEARVGAFQSERFLTQPLSLQHSDRDFYSIPEWNADLCSRIKQVGGSCFDFTYPGNTHALGVSKAPWFSGEGAVPGFHTALQRDIALFRGGDPGAGTAP
jgi:dienelactone hydrolase